MVRLSLTSLPVALENPSAITSIANFCISID
jgi:hypothetical protein